MKRVIVACVLAVCALQAHAQTSPGDALLSSLRAKGYVILSQERTWLGRERVVAENSAHRRELVFNPGTGEILRDYAVLIPQGTQTAQTEKPAVTTTKGTTEVVADQPVASMGVTPDISVSDPVVTRDGTVAP